MVPAFREESWDPWDVGAQCVFYKMVIISFDNVRLINSRVPMSGYQMGSHVTITRRPIIIVLSYPGNSGLNPRNHMSHAASLAAGQYPGPLMAQWSAPCDLGPELTSSSQLIPTIFQDTCHLTTIKTTNKQLVYSHQPTPRSSWSPGCITPSWP